MLADHACRQVGRGLGENDLSEGSCVVPRARLARVHPTRCDRPWLASLGRTTFRKRPVPTSASCKVRAARSSTPNQQNGATESRPARRDDVRWSAYFGSTDPASRPDRQVLGGARMGLGCSRKAMERRARVSKSWFGLNRSPSHGIREPISSSISTCMAHVVAPRTSRSV